MTSSSAGHVPNIYIKKQLRSCAVENVRVTRLSHAANVAVLDARIPFAGDQLVAIAGTSSTTDVLLIYPVAVKAQGRVVVKGTVKIKPRRCNLKFIRVSNDSKSFGK